MIVEAGLVTALERAEMDAFTDLYRAASGVPAPMSIEARPVLDGVLLSIRGIDVLAMNRLIGLGLRASPRDDQLEEAIAAIAATGAPRVFVQIAPVADHASLAARLEQRGLRHYNNWMRLHRSLDDLDMAPAAQSDVSVRAIGLPDAGTFGRLVSTAFGYPPSLAPVVEQVVGRHGWHHYLAYEGDVAIGAAAMFLSETTAWFGFAATDQAYRRRGAQQALVRRRLADAATLGCTSVSIETAEDTITRDAPSFRNLRRLGFEVGYTRANYLWTRPES